MFHNEPAPTTVRTRSATLVALVVVTAALIGVLGYLSLTAPSSSATSIFARWPFAHRPHESLHGDRRSAADEADGAVTDDVTVFDDQYPAVRECSKQVLASA